MKPLHHLAAFWHHFTPAERHQTVGALCFLLALFYGLLFWYPDHKQLGDLTYKQQKQAVRDRTAAKANSDPTKNKALQNFNIDGLDVQATRQELARAQASLATLDTEQTRLMARFVPLEDLESLQALKSELARLAESGDMEVTALEHIYRRPDDRERPPTLELLKEASAANPYKRPLLRLQARASYRGLMEFLDGLPKLSKIAAPVWSDITVKTDRPSRDKPLNSLGVSRQWLEVEIRLAI
jgi:type II secretory pathway component PulM